MSPDSSTALRLSALYAATFLGLGILLPYLPVWLASRNLGADEIGILLAIPMVVRLLVSPWAAGLADGRFGAAAIIVVVQCMVAASQVLLPLATAAPVLAILIAFGSLAQSPVMPLCDVLAIGALRRFPRLHYGRIRLWGSVAYLAANVAGGALIGAMGASVIPPLLAGAAALAAFVALTAPRLPPVRPAENKSDRSGPIPPVLILVICAAALIQASHAMIYAFGSISFQAAGFSSTSIGVLWSLGVLAEIVLFAVFGRAVGPRFPAFLFLAIGATAAAMRWGAMALGPSPWLLALLMALHGISFGATHLGTIGAFARYGPERSRARSQGVLVSATALATLCSGPLYGRFAGAGFAGMVPVAVLGLVAVLAAARLSRKAAQPQSAGEGGRTTLPS